MAGHPLWLGLPLSLILGACGGDECYPMRAHPFDGERSCVSAVSEVVGCTLDEIGTADAPCVKRLSDGALFVANSGSIFRGSDEWGECTSEEMRMTRVFCTGSGRTARR